MGYIVGMAKNDRLNRLAASLIEAAEQAYHETGAKQRRFTTEGCLIYPSCL